MLILACKKLHFNFVIFLVKKKKRRCQFQAFNTEMKLALAFNKEFKSLVFIAIFLDKVGVFYN